MAAEFMSEDFLLATKTARTLYHEYAETMPIYDYHCHLPAEKIADDHRFDNLTQIWLYGDHYKWRAMRAGLGAIRAIKRFWSTGSLCSLPMKKRRRGCSQCGKFVVISAIASLSNFSLV